jgi:hypothetical protein
MGVTRNDADYIISLEAHTSVDNTNTLMLIGEDWLPSTRYQVGQHVCPRFDNGHVYLCTASGISGATEPTFWPKKVDATIKDGGIIWTCLGEYPIYEVIQVMGQSTYGDYISKKVLANRRQL